MIKEESIQYIIDTLEKSIGFYAEEKNINLYQAFCWELLEWIHREDKNDERIKRILLDIGQAYEDEAEYQGGRIKKSNHVKAHFLECAVNHYIQFGIRDKVYGLKVRIKEAYRQGKDEIAVHEYNVDIPNYEEIENEVKKWILENATDSFELFSRIIVYNFVPKIEEIIKTAKERQLEPLWDLIGISRIHEDRKIFDANSEDERERYFIAEEYNSWLQLLFSIMYNNAWNKIVEQGLSCEMVVNRIIEWECMKDEDTEIIKVGIERYFDNDYVSALHILVPKFESCFREFFTWGGYPTTSIKKSVTQHEQTFNEFIENDYVKSNIDPNILFMIKYIMLDNVGYNLRNDIAHGLINQNMLNKNIANMVLCLYFILTNLCWQHKESI